MQIVKFEYVSETGIHEANAGKLDCVGRCEKLASEHGPNDSFDLGEVGAEQWSIGQVGIGILNDRNSGISGKNAADRVDPVPLVKHVIVIAFIFDQYRGQEKNCETDGKTRDIDPAVESVLRQVTNGGQGVGEDLHD